MLSSISDRFRNALFTGIARPVDRLSHERLRLQVMFGIAIFKLLNFIGGAWDIQWHVAIGRDSLFIPPHLLVLFAFVSGISLALAMILYESALTAASQPQPNTAAIGRIRAPAALFGVFFGYLAALASGGFDELWHRTFGIDATLWSPPHLMIMLATVVVDFSLMLGIAASARRLGYSFTWKSPYTWGILLTGAYAFESVNFQMGEAFIVGYRTGGSGLSGLLFPLLVGIALPLSMITLIRLARRFHVVLFVFMLTLLLQYAATGIAAAGFDILKPISLIDDYVLQNPDSTAAKTREFAAKLGQDGLIGFHQAWTMSLSAVPLALVALLELFPQARRQPLVAAPVFAVSMVLASYLWFQQTPVLADYPISIWHILLACLLSAAGSLVTGSLGLRLTRELSLQKN